MNNERVKGWQNIAKLYAEYKQAIQKSMIDCLIFLKVCLFLQGTDEITKARSHSYYLPLAF